MKTYKIIICLIVMLVLMTGCNNKNNSSNSFQQPVTKITLMDTLENAEMGTTKDALSIEKYQSLIDFLLNEEPLSVEDGYEVDFLLEIKGDEPYKEIESIQYHEGNDYYLLTLNNDSDQFMVEVDSEMANLIQELLVNFNQ